MVFDKREYMKEYHKKYNEKNKERIKENNKQYREANKDKIKEYREANAEYFKKYRETHTEYFKKYRETEKCKKTFTISAWKYIGVIHPNFDELYEKYINTKNCELCNVEFSTEINRSSTTRCLDHDHYNITDGTNFRNIVCHCCNTKRR